MSYAKRETYDVTQCSFLDYKIYRTEDCKIQLDKELGLYQLTQGNWKEGDFLTVEVDDGLVTFAKVNIF